jgi:putative transcriptional regulator
MRLIPDFHSLAGQLLVAVPTIGDPRFHRAVIFICAHDPNGAMGLMLTRPKYGTTVETTLQEMDIPFTNPNLGTMTVMEGGPAEPGRGFILHDASYQRPETVVINDSFSVTATIDILRDMANSQGPGTALFAVGYAGWAAGQLENEMSGNSWITAPATPALVFDTPPEMRWSTAMNAAGVLNPQSISNIVGHA